MGGEGQRENAQSDRESLAGKRRKPLALEMHGVTVKEDGAISGNGLQILKPFRTDEGQCLLWAGAGKGIVLMGKSISHMLKLLTDAIHYHINIEMNKCKEYV